MDRQLYILLCTELFPHQPLGGRSSGRCALSTACSATWRLKKTHWVRSRRWMHMGRQVRVLSTACISFCPACSMFTERCANPRGIGWARSGSPDDHAKGGLEVALLVSHQRLQLSHPRLLRMDHSL